MATPGRNDAGAGDVASPAENQPWGKKTTALVKKKHGRWVKGKPEGKPFGHFANPLFYTKHRENPEDTRNISRRETPLRLRVSAVPDVPDNGTQANAPAPPMRHATHKEMCVCVCVSTILLSRLLQPFRREPKRNAYERCHLASFNFVSSDFGS